MSHDGEKYLAGNEAYNLWWLLNQVSHVLHRARDKDLRQYGVSSMEVAVMFIIQANGKNATISEISRWMARESHSVSELVIRMEKKGLVRKVKDLDKKNQVRVALTEKGQQAYNISFKREFIENMLSCLTKEQHQQLRPCLEALRYNALKELGMDPKVPFPQYE
jgi:DNA-binding MarR family transcriptional regulator